MLLDEATFPGVHIRCRVIGAYLLEVGDDDETKLICVPEKDHHQDHLQDLTDLPDNAREELGAFFESYRMLESKSVSVTEQLDRQQTLSRMQPADD